LLIFVPSYEVTTPMATGYHQHIDKKRLNDQAYFHIEI
jgi:hypothetical protein